MSISDDRKIFNSGVTSLDGLLNMFVGWMKLLVFFKKHLLFMGLVIIIIISLCFTVPQFANVLLPRREIDSMYLPMDTGLELTINSRIESLDEAY